MKPSHRYLPKNAIWFWTARTTKSAVTVVNSQYKYQIFNINTGEELKRGYKSTLSLAKKSVFDFLSDQAQDDGIYQKAKKLGVEFSTHCSDLYIPKNEATDRLIDEYEHKESVQTFISNIDGKTWYDIPFVNEDYWKNK